MIIKLEIRNTSVMKCSPISRWIDHTVSLIQCAASAIFGYLKSFWSWWSTNAIDLTFGHCWTISLQGHLKILASLLSPFIDTAD